MHEEQIENHHSVSADVYISLPFFEISFQNIHNFSFFEKKNDILLYTISTLHFLNDTIS